jgi:hypothetical protein
MDGCGDLDVLDPAKMGVDIIARKAQNLFIITKQRGIKK